MGGQFVPDLGRARTVLEAPPENSLGLFEVAEEILERAIAADARYSPALSALASIQARRGEYGDALDYIEKAVEAGESDIEHFRSALEFAPLHADPRFRTLLSRMVGDGSNGQG